LLENLRNECLLCGIVIGASIYLTKSGKVVAAEINEFCIGQARQVELVF